LAAHLYNSNMKLHGGARWKPKAERRGVLNPEQRKAMVWISNVRQSSVITRGLQTDTCIGHWHWRPKGAGETLLQNSGDRGNPADIVSGTENPLLSIPVKGDGTLDSDEMTTLAGGRHSLMQHWPAKVFSARVPWKVFGEGLS
jgi:alpha-L-fucosidase